VENADAGRGVLIVGGGGGVCYRPLGGLMYPRARRSSAWFETEVVMPLVQVVEWVET
jgi:hypothetical protein